MIESAVHLFAFPVWLICTGGTVLHLEMADMEPEGSQTGRVVRLLAPLASVALLLVLGKETVEHSALSSYWRLVTGFRAAVPCLFGVGYSLLVLRHRTAWEKASGAGMLLANGTIAIAYGICGI